MQSEHRLDSLVVAVVAVRAPLVERSDRVREMEGVGLMSSHLTFLFLSCSLGLAGAASTVVAADWWAGWAVVSGCAGCGDDDTDGDGDKGGDENKCGEL